MNFCFLGRNIKMLITIKRFWNLVIDCARWLRKIEKLLNFLFNGLSLKYKKAKIWLLKKFVRILFVCCCRWLHFPLLLGVKPFASAGNTQPFRLASYAPHQLTTNLLLLYFHPSQPEMVFDHFVVMLHPILKNQCMLNVKYEAAEPLLLREAFPVSC